MARSESDQAQINYNRLYPYFTNDEAKALTSLTRKLPNGQVIDVKLLNLNDSLINRMVRTRARAIQRARAKGINRRQALIEITRRNRSMRIYTIWDLIRRYEQRYPDLGDSPKAPRKPKKPITDTDIKKIQRKQQARQPLTEAQKELGRKAGLNL